MLTMNPLQNQPRTDSRNREAHNWTFAGHYDPGFATAVCAAVDELGALQTGWDGYGAPPIDPSLREAAKRLVRALPENLAFRPRVVPMSSGNLQFEWHQGEKVLELEFETDRMIHYLQWHPAASVEEEGLVRADDVDWIVGLIEWFMNGTTCA